MPSHQARRTPLPPDYQFPTPKGDGLDEVRRINCDYDYRFSWFVPYRVHVTPVADATGEP